MVICVLIVNLLSGGVAPLYQPQHQMQEKKYAEITHFNDIFDFLSNNLSLIGGKELDHMCPCWLAISFSPFKPSLQKLFIRILIIQLCLNCQPDKYLGTFISTST